MLPQFLYILIDNPALIAIPIVGFAALALWSGARSAWGASGAWILYLAYEMAMHGELLCSGEDCVKRTPLYFVYPLLAVLSVVALVQSYVHVRDRRLRQRLSMTGRSATGS